MREAHKHSSNHRQEVVASTLCGCFYCCRTFDPADICEWVDPSDDDVEVGTTALCPFCGIDSVIGDRSGFVPAPEFLQQLNRHWF
ncbi:MAG: cytoplasmic protein [Acidobacteria bacterium]|nr:cytoplasmic protein [Acidobacteriota bacterium]